MEASQGHGGDAKNIDVTLWIRREGHDLAKQNTLTETTQRDEMKTRIPDSIPGGRLEVGGKG